MGFDAKSVRERRSFTENEWKKANDEADTDDRYRVNDPFESDQKADWKRQIGRDPIVVDEIGQFLNEVLNKVMELDLGIVTSPANARATETTSADRNDIIRGIEYTGNASVARRTCFEPMVVGGFGSYGITRRDKPGSRHQELAYRIFQHRSMVLPDPTFKSMTGQGMKYCFVNTIRLKADHEADYGKDVTAEMSNTDPNIGDWLQLGPNSDQLVVESEYWDIEEKEDKLIFIDGPNGEEEDAYLSKLEKGGYKIDGGKLWAPATNGSRIMVPYGRISGDRTDKVPQVKCYITNGYAKIKESDWDTPDIPILLMLARPTWRKKHGRLVREFLSLIRPIRDAVVSLCYARNKQAVLVGTAPMNPYMAVEGQLSGFEQDWKEAHTVPKSVLQYKAIIPGHNNPDGSPMQFGPPTQANHEPAIQALEIYAQSMIKHIRSGVGASGLPTDMKRLNQDSGAALEEYQDSTDLGYYHFIEAWKQTVLFEGKIWNDLIDVAAIKGRSMPAVTMLRKTVVLQIGVEAEDPRTKEKRTIDLGLAPDHNVTVSLGQSEESNKREGDQFGMEILKQAMPIAIAQNPQLATTIVAQIIRTVNPTPEKDEIANTFDPQQKDSPQAQLQQAKGILQQQGMQLKQQEMIIDGLSRRVEQLMSGIEKQEVANTGKNQTELLATQRELLVTELKGRMDDANRERDDARAANDHEREQASAVFQTQLEEIRAELAHMRNKETMQVQSALEPEPEAVG